MKVRPSSIAAYYQQIKGYKEGSQCRKVMDLFCLHPDTVFCADRKSIGWTRMELERYFFRIGEEALSRQITARVNKLVEDKMLNDPRERECLITGNLVSQVEALRFNLKPIQRELFS